jgi:hypothetical protein
MINCALTREIILNGLYPLSSVRGFVIKKITRPKNWGSAYSMQIRKAVKNKMFPHFLSAFQWTLLVLSLAFDLNFSVAVTGAVASGGLKVIMLFHLWMLLLPAALCLVFYRIRKEGKAERYIIGLSMITVFFSIVNISLHFVNDLALLMKATEVIAWSLYNCMFSMSVYKISTTFLLPILRRLVEIEKETLRNDKKLWE